MNKYKRIDKAAMEVVEARNSFLAEVEPDDYVNLEELKSLSESNPVKKLLQLVFLQSVRDRASDIYLECFENDAKMRYKIDGVPYEMIPPPRYICESLGFELEKMFGKLKETKVKKLLGKEKFPLQEKLLGYKESAQKRILCGEEPMIFTLSKIKTDSGDQYRVKIFYEKNIASVFDDKEIEELEDKSFSKKSGLFIISGPSQSGKTTTAHRILEQKNKPYNIVLAIGGEKTRTGIHHTNENLEYASPADISNAIKQINPNIVYLDDIKRGEIAKLAIEQANMGRIIIGSIESLTFAKGLESLFYAGIEKKQIADIFIGGIEQELERKTHKKCKGKGCSICNGLGYKGMEAKMNFIWDMSND